MKKIVIGLLCMLAMACQSGNSRDTAVPGWVQNPGDGAVGSAVTHVKGLHFQEELAIARARERLAGRYGVEVSSVQTIREQVVNENAYVTSDKVSEQVIKNNTVKAHVRATWHDKNKDVIWAWVYPID